MLKPVKVNLEANKQYSYCTCGNSSDKVFCDGSHKVTFFTPMRFTVLEEKKYALCSCKKTKNPPFCDGSHRES